MSFYTTIVNSVINSVIHDENKEKKDTLLRALNAIDLPKNSELQEKANIELIAISNDLKARLGSILDENISVMPGIYDVYPREDTRFSGVNPLHELQKQKAALSLKQEDPQQFVVPGPGNKSQAPTLAKISMTESQQQAKKAEKAEKAKKAEKEALRQRMQGARTNINKNKGNNQSMVRRATRVSPPGGSVLDGTVSNIARSTVIGKDGVERTPRAAVEAKRQQNAQKKEDEMKFGGKGGSKKLKFKNFRRTKRKNLRK